MRKYLAFLLLPLLATLLQGCAPKPQEDCGFVQNVYGERISWKGEVPVTMYLHESVPAEYVRAIESAAGTWQDASGKKLFNIVTNQRVSGPINPQKDSKNVIYYFNTWESDKGSEQARTSIYWIGDQIKEADMRINAATNPVTKLPYFAYYWNQPGSTTPEPANAINIEALVIHELGHVLGLKHKDKDASVMATYLASNTDRTNIPDTDRSAVQCEY
ncbi:matrixin family metalloprotease [Bdellovibrio sp. HCB337]|uniref:matrixin family metalloprotease n=1 Tax=Bdellovibrio sp. HCB337 TaxID=3394358 RepID=UPI0039A4E00D